MSFSRKHVKTFTRQWLGLVDMLKDNHTVEFSFFLPFWTTRLSWIYKEEVQWCHLFNIGICFDMHHLTENYMKSTFCFHIISTKHKSRQQLRSPVWPPRQILLSCSFGVPLGVVETGHVTVSITVSTSPITLWPQRTAQCDFRLHCFCLSSAAKHQTMRSSR